MTGGTEACALRAFVARAAKSPAALQSVKPSGMGLSFKQAQPRLLRLLRLDPDDLEETAAPVAARVAAPAARSASSTTPDPASAVEFLSATGLSATGPSATAPSAKPASPASATGESTSDSPSLAEARNDSESESVATSTVATSTRLTADKSPLQAPPGPEPRAQGNAPAARATVAPPPTTAPDELRRLEEARASLASDLGHEKKKSSELADSVTDLKAGVGRLRLELKQAQKERENAVEQARTTRVVLAEQLERARQGAGPLKERVRDLSARVEGLEGELARKRGTLGNALAAASLARAHSEQNAAAAAQAGAGRGVEWTFARQGVPAGLGVVLGLALAILWQARTAKPVTEEPVRVALAQPAAEDQELVGSSGEPRPPAPASPIGAPEEEALVAGDLSVDGAPVEGSPVSAASATVDTSAVEETVRAWAAAWSDQRADDYLALYAPEFSPPGGQSRGAWEKERRTRVLRPKRIQVTLGPITVTSRGPADENQVRATFRQVYAADSYRDEVTKTLDLVRQGEAWRIVQESSAPLAPGADLESRSTVTGADRTADQSR